MKFITYCLTILALLFIAELALADGLCDWPQVATQYQPNQAHAIVKTQYDAALDQIQKKYDPIFQKAGYRLRIIRSWNDSTVNAQAWWTGSTCNVEMFGGLARYPGITTAAVRQVALHEIGHCLGGAPFYPGEDMSAEGQADYYSTSVGCPALGVACKASSLNLARSLASMSSEPKPWRPGPSLPAVSTTYFEHPEAQCRLQTYDAGIVKGARPRCWFFR